MSASAWRCGAVLCASLVLPACALFVDPIVPESAATADQRLVGTWDEVGGSDRAVLTLQADSTYAIEYTSGGTTSTFAARLGTIAGRDVLDVSPKPRATEMLEAYAGVMLPGHVLIAVTIGNEEIRTALLEPGTLKRALDSGQIRLPNSRSADALVLHGTTNELRAALSPYLSTPNALDTPTTWRRSTASAARVSVGVPCFEPSAWTQADELFHRDSHWVGGDSASSVDLGAGRILWLFGDSWVDPSGRGTRASARMISNTVAIQQGSDPSQAAIRFYWKPSADGTPGAFISDKGDERHWFGNGARVGDRLVLFLNRIRAGANAESFGSVAWLVENPGEEPSAWRMRELRMPANSLGVLVGFAAVLGADGFLYAFGSEDPVKSHPIYAVRWPLQQVERGDLLQPEWWAGAQEGWAADASTTPHRPVFENGQSELTVHFDQRTASFLSVHTQGFGSADIMLRAAPALTGPWSAPQLLYRPSEYYRKNAMIYSAKAHPELTGADLVLTYSTNTFNFAEQLADPQIYYPRFVRLTRCR